MINFKKGKIYFGLFWVILVSSFLFFATFLVLTANGYYFNYNSLSFEKTGMLVINGLVKDATVNFNSKSDKVSFPFKVNRLLPGRYEVSISKENYHPWSKSFLLEGGQAYLVEDLTLFYLKPQVKELVTDEKLTNKIKKEYKNQKSSLVISENEIRKDQKLVTRFSQEVSGAVYDQNSNHFFVQLGDTIHAIDSDGGNNIELLKLQKNEPTYFMIDSNKVLYLDNGKAYEAQLRN